MADAWSISDLIAYAKNFAGTLRAVKDSNVSKKRQCDEFAAEVDACAESWRNLSRQLRTPSLKSGSIFAVCLKRITDDNVAIISRLRQDLEALTDIQRKAHKKKRLNLLGIEHDSNRPLVKFIGKSTTLLRQRQIKYTNAALKLILAVALHASNLGYRHSSRSERQEIWEDQQAAINEHYAESLNANDENIPGNNVHSDQWLGNYDFHNPNGGLPLEPVATLWFRPEQTVDDRFRQGQHTETGPQDDEIAQLGDIRRQHDLQNMEQRYLTEIRGLHTLLETKDNDYEQRRREDWNNFNQQRTADKTDHNQQIRGLDTRINQLTKLLSDQASLTTSKQKEISELRGELREQKEEFQKQLDEQKTKIETLEQENKKLHRINGEQASTIGQQASTIANLRKDLEKLSKDGQQLGQKYQNLMGIARQWKAEAESREFEDEERSQLQAKLVKLEQNYLADQKSWAAEVQELNRKITILTEAREASQAQSRKLEKENQKLEKDLRTSQACNRSLREKHTKESVGPTSYPKHHKKRRQSPVRSERKVRPESISEGYESSNSESYNRDSGYSTETIVEAHIATRNSDKASMRSNNTSDFPVSSSSRTSSLASSSRTKSSTFRDDHNSDMEDYEERTPNLSYRPRKVSVSSRSNLNRSDERQQNRGLFRWGF